MGSVQLHCQSVPRKERSEAFLHLLLFLKNQGMVWNNDLAEEKKKNTDPIKTVSGTFFFLFFQRSDPQTPGSLDGGDALINVQ